MAVVAEAGIFMAGAALTACLPGILPMSLDRPGIMGNSFSVAGYAEIRRMTGAAGLRIAQDMLVTLTPVRKGIGGSRCRWQGPGVTQMAFLAIDVTGHRLLLMATQALPH